ncbi:MAG TPA: hypothetical protein VJB99_01070 [Patescibacteria group bacterium]|nr:hypothetical protein [Patescibacteria group bacterium]
MIITRTIHPIGWKEATLPTILTDDEQESGRGKTGTFVQPDWTATCAASHSSVEEMSPCCIVVDGVDATR